MSRVIIMMCWASLWCSLASGEEAHGKQLEEVMAWQFPKERPAFRELVSGKEYTRRFEEVLKKVAVKALESSKMPLRASEIINVHEELGPGYEIGLRIGYYLLEIDGTRIWYHIPRNDKVQRLKYMTSTNGVMDVDIQPGQLGVFCQPRFRPDLLYIRGDTRSEKWENEMLVATRCAKTEPELAETALFHALAKGHPQGYLTDIMGAWVNRAQIRFPETMDFAWFALNADGEKDPFPAATFLYEAALLSYKLETALDTLKYGPKEFEGECEGLEELVKAERALPLEKRAVPPPSEMAKGMVKVDMLPMAKKMSPAMRQLRDEYIDKGVATVSVSNSPTIAHYKNLILSPGAANVELGVRFLMKATDKNDPGFAHSLLIGFINQQNAEGKRDPDFDGWQLILCDKMYGRQNVIKIGYVTFSDMLVLPFTYLHYDYQTENEIYMVACGGRLEVFVNGRRVLYGPQPPDAREVLPMMTIMGTTIEVHDLKINELRDNTGADVVF